ncbi:MAG: hypothetical protein C0478_15515 [Planctomyces sp.]|nr:hypothetical protein [Planctomyces sp.]
MKRDVDRTIAERARTIYDEQLRTRLEEWESDRFVSIEPESGEYFLGETLSEAIGQSRKEVLRPAGPCHPGRASGGHAFLDTDSMKGVVDKSGRALLSIEIRKSTGKAPSALEVG